MRLRRILWRVVAIALPGTDSRTALANQREAGSVTVQLENENRQENANHRQMHSHVIPSRRRRMKKRHLRDMYTGTSYKNYEVIADKSGHI